MKPCIHVLVDDVLIEILKYLPLKKRIEGEVVCRRWQGLVYVLWLCIKNVKYHYDIKNHSVPKQYTMLLKKWIGGILLNPRMCSDPHLLLEILWLKYTFNFHLSGCFPDFWSEMDVNFIIMRYQINVDKFLCSDLDDKLLNFEFLERILKRLGYYLEYANIF